MEQMTCAHRFRVEFERVGRDHFVPHLECEAEDAQDLTEQVYRVVKGKLSSRNFEVIVNLETMTGSIEWGRFGKFTVVDLGPVE